jgi:hypothetical protein
LKSLFIVFFGELGTDYAIGKYDWEGNDVVGENDDQAVTDEEVVTLDVRNYGD